MVPIMLMNQSGQIQGQLNQGQLKEGQIMSSNLQMLSSNIVLTQPNVQLIPSTTVMANGDGMTNPSGQINPSTWTIGSGMPSSVPSPVTPSGKKYKQTFFDDDVELIREAMKKLTKHVNSVSTVKKIHANVKFYSEFQSYLIKMLSDKNTEILDIEHQYRSNSSEDSTEKYARATKPGVPISAEMKLKQSEEMGKDAEALQIMMDNVKKAFSLKEERCKKLDKTKGQGSEDVFKFDSARHFECFGSKIPAKDKSENEGMVLNSGIEEEKDRPKKPSTKKGVSTKVRDIRRVLMHVLCGSGMLKISRQGF